MLQVKENGVSRKLACFTLDESRAPLTGNETIYANGTVIGLTSRQNSCLIAELNFSAGYGYTIGKHIAFGYIPTGLKTDDFEIEVYGQKYKAKKASWTKSLYDPERLKVLC